MTAYPALAGDRADLALSSPRHRADLPARVEVMLLREWHPAVAHASRVTPRGRLVLVSLGRQLTWVPSERVRFEATEHARLDASS